MKCDRCKRDTKVSFNTDDHLLFHFEASWNHEIQNEDDKIDYSFKLCLRCWTEFKLFIERELKIDDDELDEIIYFDNKKSEMMGK